MDFKNLYIFELANNHQGSVEHGLNIIRAMGKIAKEYHLKAAVKLQYRDLDTFIHPNAKNDLHHKHIGRFLQTALSKAEFKILVDEIKLQGMVSVVTPFDEVSVGLIEEHGVDIIKIASCSSDDWPLLNRVAKTDLPVITSTGGLSIAAIDNLFTFLNNRNKAFALLHCVGIYPSPIDSLNLSFISKMKKRYTGITIGYSGHEDPENNDVVKVAAAMGAEIFERHVGIATENVPLNSYSMSPEQVERWVIASLAAKAMIGTYDKQISDQECSSLLSLKRGVFVNKSVQKGQAISAGDVYFAMPCQPNQLTAGEFGRLRARYAATKDYAVDEPVFECASIDNFYRVRQIINRAKGMLSEYGITLNEKASIELSHHYGLENFEKFGAMIITLVNREYCKKIIVVFAGQHHPEQRHIKKEETFHILEGELFITLNGIPTTMKRGEIVTIERGVPHSFYSENGAVIEEISTTHYKNDSFYTDPLISEQDPMQMKTIINAF